MLLVCCTCITALCVDTTTKILFCFSSPKYHLKERDFAEENRDENYGFGLIANKREETAVFNSFAVVAAAVFLLVTFARGWIEVGAVLFLQAVFVIVASAVRQACYFVDEARHVQCRHHGSYCKAWQACFGVPVTTRWPVPVVLVLCLLVSFLDIYVVVDTFNRHWRWMLLSAFLCHLMTWYMTKVEAAYARANAAMNRGRCHAVSYYCGYLKLLANPQEYSLVEESPSLLDRIKEYEEDNKVEIAVKKLFILMPSSCRIDPVLGAGQEDDGIEPANSMKELCLNIAGVKRREYKNTVYLISNGDDDPFYCLAEGATPLLTLRDMKERLKLTDMQLREQLCYFYQTLEELLNDDEKCADLFRLVLYEDCGSAGSRSRKVSDILREEILRERQGVASECCD